MLTLSGAPDRVVSWSDFSLLHIKGRKLNRICHTSFQALTAFTGFVILTTCWSSVVVEYKQPSLAYSYMCYLLSSHVEYRIIFSVTDSLRFCYSIS